MQPALLEKQHASTQASAAHHNQFLQKLRRKTMSNINNQAQLYAFDAVQDLNSESAASVSGGVFYKNGPDPDVIFYDGFETPFGTSQHFTGARLRLNASIGDGDPNIGIQNGGENGFNDRASGIVIRRGRWNFYGDSNFRGQSTGVMGPGRYVLGANNNKITSAYRVG
jgi:hypothetical protein